MAKSPVGLLFVCTWYYQAHAQCHWLRGGDLACAYDCHQDIAKASLELGAGDSASPVGGGSVSYS